MNVHWPMSRGLVPKMPPETIVPAVARPALKEVEALDAERARLEGRMREIPRERRAAEADYRKQAAKAVRTGGDSADNSALQALDVELEEVRVALPGIKAEHRAAALDFADVIEPTLPDAKAGAVKETDKALADLETLLVDLDAVVGRLQTAVGVAAWADRFQWSPTFKSHSLPKLRDTANDLRIEQRRLASWVADETPAKAKPKKVKA